MKTGTVVAISVAVIGAGALGYVFYKRSQGAKASAAPGAYTPAGTSATGVQQYVNQAGQIVDAAGKAISSGQGILDKIIGGTAPASDPAIAQAEGKVFRFCSEVAKGRCGKSSENANNGRVYLIKDGLRRYVPNDTILNQYGGWAAVKDVSATFMNQFKDGPALGGLSGLNTTLLM